MKTSKEHQMVVGGLVARLGPKSTSAGGGGTK